MSSRGRYILALAIAASLLTALVVAALGGAFSGGDDVGTVIPGGPPSGPPVYRQGADETVLASGSTPLAGPWRLTAYESEGTVDEGVEVEPAGLPCMRLMLADPPLGTPFAGRGFCGERGEGGFSVSSLVVEGVSGETETILFGNAPESATAVRLTGPGGRKLTASSHDGPGSLEGDVWALAADPEIARDGQVEWIGPDGQAAGTSLSPGKDVSGQLDAVR